MAHRLPSETGSTRSRLDHLVNLEGFYDGVKKWQRAFGVCLLVAIIGHASSLTALPPFEEWNVFGKGHASRGELWWTIGSVLFVSLACRDRTPF
jgi:hypothetical protein